MSIFSPEAMDFTESRGASLAGPFSLVHVTTVTNLGHAFLYAIPCREEEGFWLSLRPCVPARREALPVDAMESSSRLIGNQERHTAWHE